MATFRKKPVEIEAVQFVGLNQEGSAFGEPTPDWLNNAMADGTVYLTAGGLATAQLKIATLEGDHTCSPGDFIIRGVKGELYPCKPDIFAATYDAVAA